MDDKERIADLAEEKYIVTFGIRKRTFEAMPGIVESAYKEMRRKGGRARKLSVLDMLVITLGYYHDYRTMENSGFDYGVHKQRISEAVSRAEQTLIKDGTFSLPSKRELVKENSSVSIVITDVTECETERPEYGQKESYSGKKNGIQ